MVALAITILSVVVLLASMCRYQSITEAETARRRKEYDRVASLHRARIERLGANMRAK